MGPFLGPALQGEQGAISLKTLDSARLDRHNQAEIPRPDDNVTQMTKLPFLKMHGLGNDFVVLDARRRDLHLTVAQRQWLADRHFGIGCDQLVTLENPVDPTADIFMRLHNADGSEARACGNATRCIAARVMGEKANGHAIIETVSGLLTTESLGNGAGAS